MPPGHGRGSSTTHRAKTTRPDGVRKKLIGGEFRGVYLEMVEALQQKLGLSQTELLHVAVARLAAAHGLDRIEPPSQDAVREATPVASVAPAPVARRRRPAADAEE